MTVPTNTPKLPKTPTDPPVLMDAMRTLGFDPDLVAAVVLTSTSAVAIAANYPQPYVRPEAS